MFLPTAVDVFAASLLYTEGDVGIFGFAVLAIF